ncbi:MAG: transposase [Methanobrevibacter sp.]|nr:transposase [Methanobrevibacter sp.]
MNLFPKWEDFRRNRWKIEKVFEFMKDQLKSKSIHTYTKRSVFKHMFLNVLLMGLIVNMGYGTIERITKLVNFE